MDVEFGSWARGNLLVAGSLGQDLVGDSCYWLESQGTWRVIILVWSFGNTKRDTHTASMDD